MGLQNYSCSRAFQLGQESSCERMKAMALPQIPVKPQASRHACSSHPASLHAKIAAAQAKYDVATGQHGERERQAALRGRNDIFRRR